MNLLIYFQPGARGDFLANILLNTWVASPIYKKIHHINHHYFLHKWEDISSFDGLKIRIDPGLSARNLLQIQLNHQIKNNNIKNFTIKEYDDCYVTAGYFVIKERPYNIKNKNLFDYWIDFSNLGKIEFLEEFYNKISGQNLSSDMLDRIITNIQEQPKFNVEFEKLALLLQFEIDNNLLDSTKYFNMYENLYNIENFLNLENYSNKNDQNY